MDVFSGPALGKRLKELEAEWIVSEFYKNKRTAFIMFKFLENLVDPYADYKETDTPPTTLWSFMWEYSQPFKAVFLFHGRDVIGCGLC